MTAQDTANQAEADAIEACLDEDLAAPIRGLPWQRRTTDRHLLAVQQIRLMRALLEQLRNRNDSGEGRSNG